MKWLVGALAMTSLACQLGCSRADISSDGKILHVVICHPRQNASDKAIQMVEDAIPRIPSKAPTMERFEWGSVDGHDNFPGCLCLLVLFKDEQSPFDQAYQQALDEAGEAGRLDEKDPRFIMGDARTYLLHDATPDVRTTTHGHLRRVVLVKLESDTTSEQMQTFEDAVASLPNKIPNIQRLEWGASTGYDPARPKPIEPAYRDGSYILLFTFAGTRERDACLAHSAYKEFQSVLEKYTSSQSADRALEYEAQVEYIARPD